ncbi:unnamed protein product, partial [Mesorhabditis spiculigera]
MWRVFRRFFFLILMKAVFPINTKYADASNLYEETIDKIFADIEAERRLIFSSGRWIQAFNWSPATNNQSSLNELTRLNNGLLKLKKNIKEEQLGVKRVDGQVRVNIDVKLLFHNNHDELPKNKYSLSYLPLMGMLYNANPREPEVLHNFRRGCDKYNPLKLMQEYAEALSVNAGLQPTSQMMVVNELLRLERRATDDRLHFYMLAILHTECLALSQRNVLRRKGPIPLTGLYQYAVVALNILQRKYLAAARLIAMHGEL